jgi:large subunit ribosomal protein L24e
MEQRVCTFCGHPLEPGTGRLYVRKDGTTFYFDSKKCLTSMLKHERTPRYVKWTLHYPRGGDEAEAKLAKAMATRETEIAEHDAEVAEVAAGGAKKPAAKKAEKKPAKAAAKK